MRNSKTAFVLVALLLHLQFSIAQSSKKEALYLLQTSEMNDLMIRYQADLESIMRFYSTNGTRSEWWNNQGRDNRDNRNNNRNKYPKKRY